MRKESYVDAAAVLIYSKVAENFLWFSFDEDMQPYPWEKDIPVFYASELPVLRDKSPDEVRQVYRTKQIYGGKLLQ